MAVEQPGIKLRRIERCNFHAITAKSSIMENSASIWQSRCNHAPVFRSVPHSFLAKRLGSCSSTISQRRQQKVRLHRIYAAVEAEREADADVVEQEDLNVEDLNTQDFRNVFDQLLGKSKTRFDVGDKVHGVVERYIHF